MIPLSTPSDAQVRRREALKKKETSQDDLEPDPARERIQNLKGLLAKLDAAVDLLQGGARDPEDDAAPWSGLSFGYEASDFVDAFRAVARAPASDEALGRAARAVGGASAALGARRSGPPSRSLEMCRI